MNRKHARLDLIVGASNFCLLFWTVYVRRGRISVGDVLVILSLVAFGFFLGVRVANR